MSCPSEMNKILILQTRALRMISYKDALLPVSGPLYPTDPLFHELEIMKMNNVFKLQVAKFIFNCMHLNTSIFHNWFTLNHMVHNYNTRSTFFDIDNAFKSNNLFVVNARTTHGFKLLKVSGPKLWNLIPCQIRSLQSWNSFKWYFKKYLIAQYV